MDSAKNEKWIIPFKKFSRLRVKLIKHDYEESLKLLESLYSQVLSVTSQNIVVFFKSRT